MKVDGTEIGLSFFSQLERRQRGIDFLIPGKTRVRRDTATRDIPSLSIATASVIAGAIARSRLNSNRYSGESPFSVISRLLAAPLVVRSISWTNCSIFEAAPEVISC